MSTVRVGVVEGVLRLHDEWTGVLTRAVTQLEDAGKKAERMGRHMSEVGQRMTTTLTAPIALVGGGMVKAFASFDDALTNSIAIMGNVSDVMRDKLADQARAVSTELNKSAKDAAASYLFLGSAGYNAAEALEVLPVVARFAQAGIMEMASATTYLADAQSALGMRIRDDAVANMENMTRVADVLTKANIIANGSVEDFSLALTHKAGVAMRQLNIDVESGVAVLAAWADQGVKAQLAGERFNIATRDLQTASIKHREEFEKYKIEVFDATGTFRAMSDIIEDMEDALMNLNDEQQRTALLNLGFQDRSVQATQSLIGLSSEIRRYEGLLRDAGGATKEISEQQMQSFLKQMGLVKNALVNAAAAVGETIAPAISQFVESVIVPAIAKLEEFADWFGELPEPIRNASIALVAFTAALGPVVVIVGGLITIGGAVASAFASIGGPMIAAIAAVTALAAVLSPLVAVTMKQWVDVTRQVIDVLQPWWERTERVRAILVALAGVIRDDVVKVVGVAARLISALISDVKAWAAQNIDVTRTIVMFVVNANDLAGALKKLLDVLKEYAPILREIVVNLNPTIALFNHWIERAVKIADGTVVSVEATKRWAEASEDLGDAIPADVLNEFVQEMRKAEKALSDGADVTKMTAEELEELKSKVDSMVDASLSPLEQALKEWQDGQKMISQLQAEGVPITDAMTEAVHRLRLEYEALAKAPEEAFEAIAKLQKATDQWFTSGMAAQNKRYQDIEDSQAQDITDRWFEEGIAQQDAMWAKVEEDQLMIIQRFSDMFKMSGNEMGQQVADALYNAGLQIADLIAGMLGRLTADLLGTTDPTKDARQSEAAGLTLTRDREQENRDLGRTIGQIGGTIGAAFTGPLAPFLAPIFSAIGGEIGAWMGGLFGGGSDPFSSFDLAVENGQVIVDNLRENKRDAEEIEKIGNSAIEIIEETFATFGATIDSLPNLQFFEKGGKIEIRSNEAVIAVAETVEEAIQALVLKAVEMADVSGISPEVEAAIKLAASESGNDLAKFSAELGIIQELISVEYTDAMSDMISATEDMIESAIHYSLSFDQVVADFTSNLQDMKDKALAPIQEFLPEVETMADKFDQARENAAQYNNNLQTQIDLRVQELAASEAQLATMLEMGQTGPAVEKLKDHIEALRAVIAALGGEFIDIGIIDKAEADAGKPKGGGGRRQARESFEEQLTDVISSGLADVDAIVDEYRRSVEEISEQTAKLNADADLAGKAIETLTNQHLAQLAEVAAQIGSSIGISTFATRMSVTQLRRDLDSMVQAMVLAGASMEEVLQALGEANLQIFLNAAMGMAEQIGDEQELKTLKLLNHELELANHKARILMLHKEGLVNDQQFADLVDLVDRWDKHVRDLLIDGPDDPPDDGTWPKNLGGGFYQREDGTIYYQGEGTGSGTVPQTGGGSTVEDARKRALDLLSQYEDSVTSDFSQALKKILDDFKEIADVLGETERVIDARIGAIDDLLRDQLAPIMDLQQSLLTSEFSPLKIDQQLEFALSRYRALVAAGDPSQAGEIASLAQEILRLRDLMFSSGSAASVDLFEEIQLGLSEFQMNAAEQAAEMAEISVEELATTKEIRDLQAKILEQLVIANQQGGGPTGYY